MAELVPSGAACVVVAGCLLRDSLSRSLSAITWRLFQKCLVISEVVTKIGGKERMLLFLLVGCGVSFGGTRLYFGFGSPHHILDLTCKKKKNLDQKKGGMD